MTPNSKILIVLTGSLGDVVRGFAVVTRIKAALPGAQIDWLVESRWKDLVALHPAVGCTHVFHRNRPIHSLLSLRRSLQAQHYDVCLDLQRIFRSGVLSLLSGAVRRIGFNRKDSKEFNWLFNCEHIKAFGETLPKVLHYLAFVDYLGISGQEVDFGVSGLDLRLKLPEQIRGVQSAYTVFVMGSSWASKNWIGSGYVKVIQEMIASTSDHIILVGEKSDQAVASEVAGAIASDRLVDLTGKTTLIELCALLRYARVAVGPDSGPAHVASAFGVPYVTLFGPTLADRVAPYGNEQLQIRSAIACSPCYRRHCPGLDRLCMRLISPQAVLEKLGSVP